jgi:type II secretory pathway component GspD/PulD (secretin)
MMSIFIRLLAFTLMLISISAHAVTDFKIITLQHRFADDILPIIQPLAGDDGVITGMQNQIIIRVSPERMPEIEQAIANLDTAQQNLKITVSHQNNSNAAGNGVSVSGRQRIGNVEVTTNRYPNNRQNGVQVGIQNHQSSSRNSGNQFINVMDGGTGFIRVGQSVPFTQEWVTYMRRYVNVQRTTEFVDITTGFAVRARSSGNEVEVEITPRIAKQGQQGFIDFEELSTVIRVNKGEWFDLGGSMQQNDEVSRAILSQQNGRQSQDNHLEIRID